MIGARLAAGILLTVLVAMAWGSGAGGTTFRSSPYSRSVFYLELKAGQCAFLPMRHKHLRVVPCLNGLHQIEVFAVTHGGWGLAQPPPHRVVVQLSFTVCNNALLARFRHVIRPPYGYIAYWPDPGAETNKYGDRMICALDLGGNHPPMGPGTHYRR